jgi:hypothetical protein
MQYAPPSMTSAWPVMKAAAGPHSSRNSPGIPGQQSRS